MNPAGDELCATEIRSPTGPTGATKRKRDDLDGTDDTETNRASKRQRFHDDIISEVVQEPENFNEQASIVEPHQDITEPNTSTHPPAIVSDETENTITHRLRVDNIQPKEDAIHSESHDGEAHIAFLLPDSVTDYANQAEPNNTGDWEERDWTTLTIEELFSNPDWDYMLDPLFEPQPFEPTQWFSDDDPVLCPTTPYPQPPESDAAIAGLQVDDTGGLEIFDEHLFSPDMSSSSWLMSGRNSLESQTTELTALPSPVCVAPSVEGLQSPSSEEISLQTSYSNAFEPELWQSPAAYDNVGTGEFQDDGPASNFPLQDPRPCISPDGDEIQVKE
ncbi:hypothetical protein NEUTE1DRAFT_43246 [Neurospora tetrasperma FGSC 2508]|uniref:Uncharacterized protein n=1 Tax=Neurospora tetrasperma (strain FGSC 2508 / ATCC MYA-4615 / P0657) TaxID=510951 RepID=F8MLC6_NEUT8|nr:uncharacterized protein NEUTE1DRAFT_43246 [Neurospora tetrasperma FGSC 2508]EGO58399.1 hypothetical protein NEUTE1DRAFT_43246 [Neurospora tetrasperma FGSC 2508]EGZ71270.1 hypothetical protein NEUTE2DRAFT_64977 [Neurospora tetrasperma FGSC 2509]